MKRFHYSRGFSVTELAIVLGVMGTVIGGLWALADQYTSNTEQIRFTDELTTVVRNIRSVFTGVTRNNQSGIPISISDPILLTNYTYWANPAGTGTPNAFKIYPPEFVQADIIKTSWRDTGGNPFSASIRTFKHQLYPCGWTVAGGSSSCTAMTGTDPKISESDIFAIEVMIPDAASCVKAVLRNSGNAIPGLIDISINGNVVVNSPSNNPLPVAMAVAQSGCNQTPNVVDFVYKLHP